MVAFQSRVQAGNIAANIAGDFGELPALPVAAATIYQLLSGQAANQRGQGEALERWLREQRAGVVAGGIAAFDWPGPAEGAGNRSRRIRFDATADVAAAVARITDSNLLARGGVHELELEVRSVGEPSLVLSRAAADPARLPLRYRAGSADLTLPYGQVGLLRIDARADFGLVEAIDAGRMGQVPVSVLASSAASGGQAGGFSPVMATTDRGMVVWFRTDGTSIGAAPAGKGYNGYANVPGTGCAMRAARIETHVAGAFGGTGAATNATRTLPVAYRGGTIGALYASASQVGSDGSLTFPQWTGLPAGAQVFGATARALATRAIPAGATGINGADAASGWSFASWRAPQGVTDWTPAPIAQTSAAWISFSWVEVPG